MKLASTLILTALSLVSVGCGSTAPVRRAPNHGPDQPVPTLIATSVYDYGAPPEVEEIEVQEGASFGDFLKGVGKSIEDNPEVILDAAGEIIDATSEYGMLQELAPALDAKIALLLAELGFEPEKDGARTAELPTHGNQGFDHDYVTPGTAACSFQEFAIFGTTSKSSIIKKVKTDRAREAYAGITTRFDPEDEDDDGQVSCLLLVRIIDQDGEVVFDGETTGRSGSSPGLHAKKLMEKAFDSAVEQMRRPVIEEI